MTMNIIKNFIEQHGITEQQLIDGYKQGLQIILENASKISKQETLEEAAEIEKAAMDKLKSKWSHLYTFGYPQRPFPTNYENDLNNIKVGLYEGAKWQAKKMYSEEEVIKIIQECKSYLSFGDEFNEIVWFEQFKKKQ